MRMIYTLLKMSDGDETTYEPATDNPNKIDQWVGNPLVLDAETEHMVEILCDSMEAGAINIDALDHLGLRVSNVEVM